MREPRAPDEKRGAHLVTGGFGVIGSARFALCMRHDHCNLLGCCQKRCARYRAYLLQSVVAMAGTGVPVVRWDRTLAEDAESQHDLHVFRLGEVDLLGAEVQCV